MKEVSKFRPKRKDKLIPLSSITEEMRLIDGSDTDYITPSGKVYKLYEDDLYFPKKVVQNNVNLYMYVNITFSDGKNRQRRQHVLMAKAYIPNPDPEHLKIVGHKDDVKWHNTLDNLYWTDNQENTQSAVNHKLNVQPIAEQNENSILIKVLDKNTKKIVGVYGSLRECERCIENISLGLIARMCKKENYTPRTRKYIYQITTREEFEQYLNLRSKHLVETTTCDKSPKVFYLINDLLGYKQIFDNQTQASKICGLSQAQISHMIKNGVINNGWRCEYLNSISYTESSSYQNLLQTCDQYVLQNIRTKEIRVFNTQKDVKDELGINGHDISEYLNTGHTLMNDWKIIAIENKDTLYKEDEKGA